MRRVSCWIAISVLSACGPSSGGTASESEAGEASESGGGGEGATSAGTSTTATTTDTSDATSNGDGDTSNGDGDTGDGDTGDGTCSGYGNEYGPVIDVTITNARNEPMYLDVDGCNMALRTSVLDADTGTRVGTLTDCWTCEGALNGGCVCPGPPCFTAVAIRLEPGASYETAVAGTEFIERELSSECADTDFCGTTCAYATVLGDGSYEVEIAAGSQVTCTGPSCDCVPGPEGWCWIESDGTINALADYGGTFEMPMPGAVTIDIL